MATYTQFLPRVLIDLPKCPVILAEDTVKDVIREFCEETWMWEETQNLDISATEWENGYNYVADDTAFNPTQFMTYICIADHTSDSGNKPGEGADWADYWEEQRVYTLAIPEMAVFVAITAVKKNGKILMAGEDYETSRVDTSQIEFTTPPSTDDTIKVKVALSPSGDATSAPDWIYRDWHRVIEDGAKAQLLLIPKKVWTDPNLAVYYNALYSNGIALARGKAMKGYSTKSLRVKPRAFTP